MKCRIRATAVIGLLAAVVAFSGCAGSSPYPMTFNAALLAADGAAAALGRTCRDLSERERISVERTILCRNKVAEAGSLIDTARQVGQAGGGGDRIAAARQLLLDFEAELRKREETR